MTTREAYAVPAGWKLVPEDPTEDMQAAGWIDKEDVSPKEIYWAMLQAAPLPPDEWRLGPVEASPLAKQGFVLVPVEMTEAMRDAGVRGNLADVSYADVDMVWPAILHARPTPDSTS